MNGGEGIDSEEDQERVLERKPRGPEGEEQTLYSKLEDRQK